MAMTHDSSGHERRIVVGVDGSGASRAALSWGHRQAARTGVVLQPTIAYYSFPMPIQEVDFRGMAQNLAAEEIREVIKDPGDVSLVPAVIRGYPARVLIEASRGADLLVVGNRGGGGIAGALLGSVSLYCVQHARCPVAILREETDMAGGEPRIVVGVDGSPSSKAALSWAIQQAAVTGMAVEAFIAWRIPTYYGYSLAPDEVDLSDIAGLAARTIGDAVDQLGGAAAQVKITTAVVRGDPAQVLLDAAAGADLLVVGNRGHGVLAEALLGSVSQHCAHHASCPVVIVRDPARYPS
jgi:nucleotide-binding universal stress UspA family protein